MNEMKEVYAFIDEAYNVANQVFKFFYEKEISWFRCSNIEDEDKRRELFTEAGSSIHGREKEFESAFFNLTQKYKDSERTPGDYIYIVEQAMLQTDATGRIAIARRLIRKLGELARIGVVGIDEITGIEFCCSADYWFECTYKNELETKGNMYKVPDNLIKTIECMSFIFSIEHNCLHFMESFKELCRDFDIAYEEEVAAFGFDGLGEITRVEWRERRKSIQKQDFKPLIYKDIFRSPWKSQLNELEKILSAHGYINNGQWVGENGKKSELAELYHYLKMESVIAQGDESKQLNALYSKFELRIGKDNTRNGEYCTLRTLRKVNGDSDTKERFEQILKAWVNKQFTT